MTDIAWSLDALSADAQAWECVSARLSEVASMVDGLTVTSADLMGFLPSAATAAATTSAACEAIGAFSREGAEKTAAGADVLREVRDAYVAHERDAVQSLDGLWEPEDLGDSRDISV